MVLGAELPLLAGPRKGTLEVEEQEGVINDDLRKWQCLEFGSARPDSGFLDPGCVGCNDRSSVRGHSSCSPEEAPGFIEGEAIGGSPLGSRLTPLSLASCTTLLRHLEVSETSKSSSSPFTQTLATDISISTRARSFLGY